jgi:RNA polymerase subunit RPABC4/transcription elongation factor Spt4
MTAADEKYCFSCGSAIKKAAEICPKCGVNQSKRSSSTAIDVYCTSCGKSIKNEASVCPFCGVSQGITASGIKDKKGPAIASLVLGINSLWAFIIPLFGYPVAVVGVIMGIVGQKSSKNRLAAAGLILSIIGLVATIVNSAIGAYQGAVSQLPGTIIIDELVGHWEGSYGANQGETGLTLNVFRDENNYKAIFYFYNLPGRINSLEGSYYMNVSFNQSKYILKGYEWIERPGNYVFVDLEGTINGNVFSGSVSSVQGGGGTTFRVVKK